MTSRAFANISASPRRTGSNSLNPPDKTPELFETFLPYAVALDVQNAWAKRFAGVLAAAAPRADGAAGMSLVRRRPRLGTIRCHSRIISAASRRRRIASASTAPGSNSGSGSSGGGSSGGGGGGGGGSGW